MEDSTKPDICQNLNNHTKLDRTDQFRFHHERPPYIRNSILSVLLFLLILFNVLFLFRGFFLMPQQIVAGKLCLFAGPNSSQDEKHGPINVVFFAKYAYKNMKIVRGIDRTIGSILMNTQTPLHFHILLDLPSKKRISRTLRKVTRENGRKLNATYYDVEDMADNYKEVVNTMKKYFFSKDVGRYNDDIFFLSEIFHQALPESLDKIIFLDVDLKFVADIHDLHEEFNNFGSNNVIGIGPDLQPQYRVDFSKFRTEHPETEVGSERPGMQGFNTGVTLFNLQKMRESALYQSILNETVIEELCKKYNFEGYLGHQDFFTLTGMEYPELYYSLDCSWNRQLDTGWLKNVGKVVFDLYHACPGEVKVYHGNGNANIPDE